MIDFHSHILPGIDDGSRDVSESIAMLEMLSEQGVDTVVATPHFYANHESVNRFLDRRQAAYQALLEKLPQGAPEILLGAEVKYYEGISRLSELKTLRIQGSKLLLLEMSMSKWTEYTVRELEELSRLRDFKVILAHIERYMSYQSPEVMDRLLSAGILMQVNASFFTHLGSRQKAIKLLESGYIHFVGSDCHNMTARPPKLDTAYEWIEKKLGAEFTSQMIEYGYRVLDRELK